MNAPQNLEELYPFIGEFMVRYAEAQGMMRTVVITLSGVEKSGGALLLHGTADGAVLRKVKFGIKNHPKGLSGFVIALERLSKIAKFRDSLAHWEPLINQDGTKLVAIIDRYKDYRNQSGPQITYTREDLKRMSEWLVLFSYDLLTFNEYIDQNLYFDPDFFNTISLEADPEVPTAQYRRGNN